MKSGQKSLRLECPETPSGALCAGEPEL